MESTTESLLEAGYKYSDGVPYADLIGRYDVDALDVQLRRAVLVPPAEAGLRRWYRFEVHSDCSDTPMIVRLTQDPYAIPSIRDCMDAYADALSDRASELLTLVSLMEKAAMEKA